MNTVSVDRKFLEHCLSVMRGVGEFCQPISRGSGDDSTEYCGGQALAELANCYNRLQETIAYAEQAALPQAEQPEAGRDEYHRCGKNIRRHKVSECRPQVQEAGRDEAVAVVHDDDSGGHWVELTDDVKDGDLLYLAPPATAEAVRLAREALEKARIIVDRQDMNDMAWNAVHGWLNSAIRNLAQHGGRGDE